MLLISTQICSYFPTASYLLMSSSACQILAFFLLPLPLPPASCRSSCPPCSSVPHPQLRPCPSEQLWELSLSAGPWLPAQKGCAQNLRNSAVALAWTNTTSTQIHGNGKCSIPHTGPQAKRWVCLVLFYIFAKNNGIWRIGLKRWGCGFCCYVWLFKNTSSK